MLLSPALVPTGPPPQRVLEKMVCWRCLILLLALTAVVRFCTLDVIGGVLSALMLVMACIMISDGMQELPRYTLVFGMLCLLCLFFDSVPLLASLGGRSEVSEEPVKRVTSNDIVRVTYTTTVRTNPFFDASRGLMYNVGSFAMLLSPMTMMLGAYLAFHAHVELQRYVQPFIGDADHASMWRDDIHAAAGGHGDDAAGGAHLRHPHGFVLHDSGNRPIPRFTGVPRRLDV
uniref:Uncharacterized protein n=1 Tax=Zooxanthella nutricula TaxID=1333877 RepID=A0A6U6SKF1_9DINO|mmetsp:Transcript_76467/g.233984  ORF Transcript_76467/g.233984 Transcript_76467/m.233984 type:complete len:231 (+) Transcript_76467:19-711(+)